MQKIIWRLKSTIDREKIEDYLRFLTHAGGTRFPMAWGLEAIRAS